MLLAIALALMLRGSLPKLDGSVPLAGLDAAVTIERDARGIPSLRAASKADLLRATGFLHGQDRFFQMDLLRRSAAGELAALFGPTALAADKYLRLHRFRAEAKRVLEDMDRDSRQLVRAYADGVNAGLAALSARPFEYWILRTKPEIWQPEDCVLVLLAMFLDLQEERNQTDATREAIRRALPPSMAQLLLAQGSPWDAPLVGAPLPTPALPTREQLDSPGRFEPLDRDEAVDAVREQGSNAWAVDGSRSVHGGSILANDMHLNLRVPNIWYPVRWEWKSAGETQHALGMTLPGAPALVIGSNGHLAWGFTNSYVDAVDLVELVDADEESYLSSTGRVRFQSFEETIAVKGAPAVGLRVRWTEFGPVLDGTPTRALQWVAHEATAVNLDLMRMVDSASLEAGLELVHGAGIPAQNVVLAAADGRVAWTLAGRLPRREFDGRFPVRSDHPRARWEGFHPQSSTPTVQSPESGSIWSASQRHICCESLALVGDGGYSLGARAGQIRDALAEMAEVDELQFLELQLDDRALFLSRWRDLLIDHFKSTGRDGSEWARRIRDDSQRASVESTGYGLLRSFRLEVHRRVLDAWLEAASTQPGFDRGYLHPQVEEAVWKAVESRPAHLLPPGFESWQALLEDAWASVEDGGAWGERNKVLMKHPLSGAIPILARWLDMPAAPAAGDTRMPHVQGPSFGSSERFVVSPGREDEALFHMPGGVSGHPLSSFYRAAHEDWLLGRPTRFVAATEHRLELHP